MCLERIRKVFLSLRKAIWQFQPKSDHLQLADEAKKEFTVKKFRWHFFLKISDFVPQQAKLVGFGKAVGFSKASKRKADDWLWKIHESGDICHAAWHFTSLLIAFSLSRSTQSNKLVISISIIWLNQTIPDGTVAVRCILQTKPSREISQLQGQLTKKRRLCHSHDNGTQDRALHA